MTSISIRDAGWLPETPVNVSPNHCKFLKKCIQYYPDGVLQKKIIDSLQLNKKTVSVIKSDLMRLGWVKDTALGGSKEVEVKLSRINEIEMFLNGLNFLGHSIPVRPHDAEARCLFIQKPENFENALHNLTHKYHTEISEMKNNRKYSIHTEYGKIILHLKGNLITFWAEGFIFPILKKDLSLLEDYVCNGIEERIFHMHSLLKEHFKDFRIEIQDIVVLKRISCGILTKQNASRTLGLSKELKDMGLFKDHSIYGLDEWERSGKIDEVTRKITLAVEKFFEKEESQNYTEDKND